MSITLNGNPEYRYIRAWGKLMGSEDSFIDSQIDLAVEMNAPEYSIYYDDGYERWVTVQEKPVTTQQYIESLVAEL